MENRKLARATEVALEHVVSGLRCGSSLDRANPAPAALTLPSSPQILVASFLGTTFTLHAPLLRAKTAALLSVSRGESLLTAFAKQAAAPSWPVAAGGHLRAPRALSARESAAWAAPHARMLTGLLSAATASGGAPEPPPACGCGWWARAGGAGRVAWQEGSPGGCSAEHARPCPVALCGVLLDFPAVYDLAHAGGEEGNGNCLGASPLLVFEGPWAFSVPAVCETDENVAAALAAWKLVLAARGGAPWGPPIRRAPHSVVC